MTVSLDGLALVRIDRPLFRNVVTARVSQDLFDDLSDEPAAWQAAISLEVASKPWPYESRQPVVDRPFEEAEFLSAVMYPFEPGHWSASRFSRGDFGVWYGSKDMDTTIHETVYHWRQGLLADAGWDDLDGVAMERRMHRVNCATHLIDLTNQVERWPDLRSNDYAFCHDIGNQVHEEGHPGLWTCSARCEGSNAALFTPKPLSAPGTVCFLTYVIEGAGVSVYRDQQERYLRLG